MQREVRTETSGESSSGALSLLREVAKQRRSKPNEKIKSHGKDATKTEKREIGNAYTKRIYIFFFYIYINVYIYI